MSGSQGRTHGGRPPPLEPEKNSTFSGFLPLNYVIRIFEVCFLSILYGKVDFFRTLLATIYEKKLSPPPP